MNIKQNVQQHSFIYKLLCPILVYMMILQPAICVNVVVFYTKMQ